MNSLINIISDMMNPSFTLGYIIKCIMFTFMIGCVIAIYKIFSNSFQEAFEIHRKMKAEK